MRASSHVSMTFPAAPVLSNIIRDAAHSSALIRRRLFGTPIRSTLIIIFKQQTTLPCVPCCSRTKICCSCNRCRLSRFFYCHGSDPVLNDGLALSLFVFWILADYSDASFSLDDLTLLADRLYRCSYFHLNPPFLSYGRMAIMVSLCGDPPKSIPCVALPHSNSIVPQFSVYFAFFAHKKRVPHKRSVYSIALHFRKSKKFFRKIQGFCRLIRSDAMASFTFAAGSRGLRDPGRKERSLCASIYIDEAAGPNHYIFLIYADSLWFILSHHDMIKLNTVTSYSNVISFPQLCLPLSCKSAVCQWHMSDAD